MSELTLLETIPVRNILGECILWDRDSQSVWWTDIHAATLYRYTLETSSLQTYDVPERLGSFGFIDGDSRLICAFASGFAFFDPVGGDLQWLYRPEQRFVGTRFNDGRVDRQGRFWSGTMVEGEARDADGLPTKGGLYWIQGAEHHKALGGIAISNGLAWSPDGTTMYFADSPTRRILAFEFDSLSGGLGDRRVFAGIEGRGAPDGSAVDADGFLWNAEWGGWKVVRYAPSGDVDLTIDLPVSQPTCVCFGGQDLDLLFVSTATDGLGERKLHAQPQAGNVLVYRTPYKGLPECRFRL